MFYNKDYENREEGALSRRSWEELIEGMTLKLTLEKVKLFSNGQTKVKRALSKLLKIVPWHSKPCSSR